MKPEHLRILEEELDRYVRVVAVFSETEIHLTVGPEGLVIDVIDTESGEITKSAWQEWEDLEKLTH